MGKELILQVILNGLLISFTYVLVALGFTYVFSILRVVTFAHGEIYMLGAYLTWVIVNLLGGKYFCSLLIATVVVFVFGLILFKLFWNPILDNPMACLVMSLGLLYIFQGGITKIFGERDLTLPIHFSGVVDISGAYISIERIVIIIASFALVTMVHFFLRDNKVGQAMRAVASNSEVAALQGINVRLIQMYGFGIACAVAGVAGGLMANISSIYPTMGINPLFKSMAIVILGGLGSIPGVFAASFIIGFIDSFGLTLIGQWANLLSLVIIILILLIRPKGLLGHEGE